MNFNPYQLRKRAAQVRLFKTGPSEEAASPEFPETRRSAFLKTLSPIHPRESAVTASSAAVTSRLNATHACTVSTLREYRDRSQRKTAVQLCENCGG